MQRKKRGCCRTEDCRISVFCSAIPFWILTQKIKLEEYQWSISPSNERTKRQNHNLCGGEEEEERYVPVADQVG